MLKSYLLYENPENKRIIEFVPTYSISEKSHDIVPGIILNYKKFIRGFSIKFFVDGEVYERHYTEDNFPKHIVKYKTAE